nr:hypothetical protein [Trichormus variabilis]
MPTVPLGIRNYSGFLCYKVHHSLLIACGEGVGGGVFVPHDTGKCCNPVTVVDKNVDKHGTRKVAQAFVDFLYSTEAQREFAKFRITDWDIRPSFATF